jgi:multiple sugar transport system substrate-binding protein
MLLGKSVIRLAAVAMLIASLAGLVFAQDADISGTINVMGFGLGDEIATERVAHFEELYPDVDVQFTEGGLDAQQFLTAVASGTPPDLINVGRDQLSTYAARGALQPLTDCIASHEIDLEQYRPQALAEVTVGGEVYGIPQFYNNVLVIVNTKALEDAGMTVEDLDFSDWDSISALNDALTVGSGNELTRIGFDPKLPEFFPLWAEANGVALLSEDGRTAQLNDPAVVEALEFAVSLLETPGGYAPFKAFRDTWDFFGGNNQVAADQIGAWPMENWYVNVLANVSPDAPLAFVPFQDREGNPLSFTGGSAWAIPTGAANPEAACEFAKVMTSVDAWVRAAEKRAELRAEAGTLNTGVATGNILADEIIMGEIVGPTGNEAIDSGLTVLNDVSPYAIAVAPNPAGAQFKQAWTDAVNRVINGEMSVQESLDQAQAEAQAVLDEAWASQEN